MHTDVVVVAFRSRADLRDCVAGLCGEEGITVHVVDNECPERSFEVVADLPVNLVRMGRNAGFGAGCNAGARAGSDGVILFLNPDARIDADDVRTLSSRLEGEPRLGAVGPRLLESDGSLQLSMRRAPRLGSAFGEAFFLHHAVRSSPWPTEIVRKGYERRQEAEWLSGAVLCVRRSAFEEIGGFDERLLLYSEDTDLCTRLRKSGYALAYEPAATARHEGGASVPRPSLVALKAHARLVYARVHERGLRYLAFRVAYSLHELVRLPLAAARSREEARARLDALLVTIGSRRRAALP